MSVKPTGEEIVKKFQVMKSKFDSLSSVVVSIRGPENVEQALSLRSIATDIKSGLDVMASDAKDVQKPVPVENGAETIKIAQEIIITTKKILDGLVAKKALLAALPIPNFKTLLTRDIQGIHSSFVNMADAGLANGPEDQEFRSKGKAARDALDEMFKNALIEFAK